MIVKTPLVVLKSFKYGDTSKIARVFSRDLGKMSIMAKGARGPRGRFGSCLEPTAVISATLYVKETREIQILSSCELLRSPDILRTDLLHIASSLALVELVDKTMHPGVPNPGLFEALVEALERTQDATKSPQLALYLFESVTLDALGFRPATQTCPSCGMAIVVPGESDAVFALCPEGFLCLSCSRFSPSGKGVRGEGLKLLRSFQQGERGWAPQGDVSDLGNALIWFLRHHVTDFRGLRAEEFIGVIS